MKTSIKPPWIFFVALFLLPYDLFPQTLHKVIINNSAGISTDQIFLSDSSSLVLAKSRPVFSFRLNDKPENSSLVSAEKEDAKYRQSYENGVRVTFSADSTSGVWKAGIVFENRGTDTVTISNVVPFGEDINSVYITGDGPWDLARAKLFRPGYRPVRVILPDNAWELGYASFYAGYDMSLCGLARRTAIEGGEKKRYETRLPPNSSVTYEMHAGIFRGEWQNGLKMMFRDRYLHDLDKFDNTLYERPDLAWIRGSYIAILQMAWDREFYDRFTGKYTLADLIKKGIDQFGSVDIYGIWPTWPRLGLDQRNQWDMYRDLPGGTQQLRNFAAASRSSGTRFFIAYNPWDSSTREENQLEGMARIIGETDADGVVLDTMGKSGLELQHVADSVKKGVIMYSEGMAVPRDMPGILAGRVHNAIYLSPELNLNKLIRPDFAIFRVCDVGEDIIHREIAVSFFNGYGTELNLFRAGRRDDNYRTDLGFLAQTTFILRQNNDAFLDKDWTPMVETLQDNVFVNRWNSGDKTIYTVLNLDPGGISGKLFRADSTAGKHFVSLWNHENILPFADEGKYLLAARATGWDSTLAGTRQEGSVDCIAGFPELIKATVKGDSIFIRHIPDGDLTVWKGNPSYQTPHRNFRLQGDTAMRVRDLFGYYEGKIVIQLLEEKKLKDEVVLNIRAGKPWIISKTVPTERAALVTNDMVLVPAASIKMNLVPQDDFVNYPETGTEVRVDSFLIDKYPVTNAQYYDFITNSGYRPADTAKYLRHWQDGTFRQGQDRYPVVYVSYEDMQAYARWAGKRLPREVEWQLAAQGTDNRKWPWGNDFHGTLCNNAFSRPTPVDAFPKGQSPYGAADLVGNVWQMTGDIYFNGTNYFGIIRGGSYYKPESSWWYIQGGPQPLDRTQMMLLVSPAFDRSATVGFRCVRDVDSRNFRLK